MRTKTTWNKGNQNAKGKHIIGLDNPVGRRKIPITKEIIEFRKIRNRKFQLKYQRERRIECLKRYSGNPPKCKCCGEKIIQFLSIDHINGGGNKHRKELGVGKAIYPWLIRNNFPKGFQVLCYNCNMAKGFYGKCPHNLQKN